MNSVRATLDEAVGAANRAAAARLGWFGMAGRTWLAALVVTVVCFPTMVLSLGSLYASLILAAVL